MGMVPQQSVKRMPSIDSMARNANCEGRYAARAGCAEDFNWGNPEGVGWHTSHPWMKGAQRRVYGAARSSRGERARNL